MGLDRKIKVVLGIPGLDSHDKGIITVAEALRDAGMEVIYLGAYQVPEGIVKASLDEDADVIGLSFHSGGQLAYTPATVKAMKDHEMEKVLLIVGGVFPREDTALLKEMGVDGVFMGEMPSVIINFIRDNVRE